MLKANLTQKKNFGNRAFLFYQASQCRRTFVRSKK